MPLFELEKLDFDLKLPVNFKYDLSGGMASPFSSDRKNEHVEQRDYDLPIPGFLK